MKYLVGYTGFVGSNLNESTKFDGVFNTKNINEAFGKNPDILFYCGIPAQKYLANKFPDKDKDIIDNAINNIKKINPKSIVLISTIDVYETPIKIDEDFDTNKQNPEPYGKNRLLLEDYVKDNFNDYLIVRLPGLYGKNLKKNFIYDFINYVPEMLNESKYQELSHKSNKIKDYYYNMENGFYKLKENVNKKEARIIFENIGFSALNFTDSRGLFQFYNLKYLYNDIIKARDNNIKLLNIVTEPVLVSDIYKEVTQEEFVNEISNKIPMYDLYTKYGYIYNSNTNYIQDRIFVLNDIKKYILENMEK